MNLSEILSSINHNKENILRDRDEREEKQYAPYAVSYTHLTLPTSALV